ncbi:MAG: PEP/pyruvate-binding domain-containing protein [Methylovirgula sp.]|jgi:pyruvate,orthophosphate dikinase
MSTDCDPLLIARDGGSEAVTAEIAGSKAAQLWQMAQLGLDVPLAFVLPTTLCASINAGEEGARAALDEGLKKGIAWLEEKTGRQFGDSRAPLLVSVRSGAAVSMPGMLETVLDVGLNDETLRGLIRMTGNPRLAYDSFRRLIQSYGETVAHVPANLFDRRLVAMTKSEGVTHERALDPEALHRLSAEFRDLMLHASGHPFPDDPREQLYGAAIAVYESWVSAKAVEYRRLNRLEGLKGTAVTVQAMVFGNSGNSSGAGVAFSRNPATGTKELYLDFLFDAQGEDIVSGRRTPSHEEKLAARLPEVAKALAQGVRRIESEMRDAQDVEFTVENGRLFFLQTRAAKRSPLAALRVALDLVHEGLLDRKTALARLDAIDEGALVIRRFATHVKAIATAISAGPGVASGRVAFDSQHAKDLAAKGLPVILVRQETSTEDVEGFALSAGILTAVGGRTAHAAVVARQLGKVCLVGCRALQIDEANRVATLAGAPIREGDWLSLNGDSGEITLGERAIVKELPPELAEIAKWRAELAQVRA